MMIDEQKATTLFWRNYHADAHVVINQGGTSAGKTYAIQQVLFCLASETENQVITIAGQDIPNLSSGAMRDALKIYSSSPGLQSAVKSFNKTNRVFEFNNGSIIEFKSYGNAQDAKAGKRDYLFVNEANGVAWDIYTELFLRTTKRIFIDFNANSPFWVHDNLIGTQNTQLIISDYRHNPFVVAGMRDKIEDLKEKDHERWRVYARGLTGKVTGLVLNNWEICESIPADARLIAAGLDFGFSNDQTGCILVYKQNGELWINELFYEKELTNADIAGRLTAERVSKNTEIVADSAEPKSIEELRRLGWNITGAKKGPDSVNNSIDILKRYRLNITRQSKNLQNELGRYKWKIDNSGRTLNQPVDSCNHLIDPLRYVALNKLTISSPNKAKSWLPEVYNLKYDFASMHLLK